MESPWCYQTITFSPFCTWVASTSTFYILAPLSVLFHPSIRGWGRKPSLRWQQSAALSAQLAIHSRNIPLLQKWGLTGGSCKFGHFMALNIEAFSFWGWRSLLIQIWRSHWIVVSQRHTSGQGTPFHRWEGESEIKGQSQQHVADVGGHGSASQSDGNGTRIHYSAHPHGDPKELHPFPSLPSSLWFLLLMSFPLFSTF